MCDPINLYRRHSAKKAQQNGLQRDDKEVEEPNVATNAENVITEQVELVADKEAHTGQKECECKEHCAGSQSRYSNRVSHRGEHLLVGETNEHRDKDR